MPVAVCRDLVVEKPVPSYSTAVRVRGPSIVSVVAQVSKMDVGGSLTVFLEGSIDLANWIPLSLSAILEFTAAADTLITGVSLPESGAYRVGYIRLRFVYATGEGLVERTSVSAEIATKLATP